MKQQVLFRDNKPTKPPQKGTEEYTILKTFCDKIKFIIQVVSEKEYRAAVTLMKPPRDTSFKRAVVFPSAGTVIGTFADKNTALIYTGQGSDSRHYIEEAITTFPKAQFVIGMGVGYAFDSEKYKLGDVIVSKQICDLKNFRFSKKLVDRGQRIDVVKDLSSIFCKDLTHENDFLVSDKNRFSKVDAGQFVSFPIIMENKEMRDMIHCAVPEAIGGDMEGGELMNFRLKGNIEGVAVIKGVIHYADGNKADEWEFTASLAALNYAHSKLYYYQGKKTLVE